MQRFLARGIAWEGILFQLGLLRYSLAVLVVRIFAVPPSEDTHHLSILPHDSVLARRWPFNPKLYRTHERRNIVNGSKCLDYVRRCWLSLIYSAAVL